jgi:dTDP-4-amino-4,6-dideoxygalactose transaminase
MVDKPRLVPFARPWIDEREVEAVRRALLSGWIIQGPEVEAFEKEFAAYVGADHACAVSSCTAALHLALLAVGVQPGDEVITVSHSFIATANSVRYCGALPVFVDIEPGTFNMNPELIDRVVTERTRAILCVHQMGMPSDLNAILKVARRQGVPVVEDAACAAGSEILWNGVWEKIGKPHGDIACFSFHPRKLISTGDGGMITTSNSQWDANLRLWRQHCMSIPPATRHTAEEVVFESYPMLGYNYRLTDIQAALGREQLKRVPEMVERRRLLGRRYRELLSDIPGLGLLEEPRWARTNWQSYSVRLPEGCGQRQAMQVMLELRVATRRGVMCAHRESAYEREPWSCGLNRAPCGCQRGTCERLIQSERVQDQTVLLPIFPQMTSAEQNQVSHALHAACSRSVA